RPAFGRPSEIEADAQHQGDCKRIISKGIHEFGWGPGGCRVAQIVKLSIRCEPDTPAELGSELPGAFEAPADADTDGDLEEVTRRPVHGERLRRSLVGREGERVARPVRERVAEAREHPGVPLVAWPGGRDLHARSEGGDLAPVARTHRRYVVT